MYLVCTSHVNGKDQVPILIFHIFETDISQDTSIIYEHIYPAKGFDRSLDDRIAILDAVVVGHGIPAELFDFFHYLIGSLRFAKSEIGVFRAFSRKAVTRKTGKPYLCRLALALEGTT